MITGRPKFFRDTNVSMDCDVCGRHFDILTGGVCTGCRRALCGPHLYGSWAQRLIAEITGKTICLDCRRG